MRRLLLFLCALVGLLLINPARVLAHNSLVASTPNDGQSVEGPPTEVVWTFAKAVPLETLTVTLIDSAGVRTALPGSMHGPAGETQVVTPLPALSPGPVTVRWRLVGADGHPVTDRVTFTIVGVPSTSIVPTPMARTVEVGTEIPPETTPSTMAPTSMASDETGLTTTPSIVRWLLRGMSYVAIIAAAGVVLTHTLILRRRDWSETRKWLEPALALIGITAVLQLLTVASDIGGRSLWKAWPDVSAAVETTDAGAAYMVRAALAAVAWLLLVHQPPKTARLRDDLLIMTSLGLLATWSFAGHSSSMRWRGLGVPVDVVHHGAAAAWLGGLTFLGLVVLPGLAAPEIGPAMRRFSRMATIAVALIVITGLLQAGRLVGTPGRVLDADHGKLLTAKLCVVAVMLTLAEVNRRRVGGTLRSAGASARVDIAALRRGMLLELTIGLLIIGITAAMVVSPPATSSAVAEVLAR
jgi:copper transport protein